MNPDIAYEEGSIVQVPPSSLEDLIDDNVKLVEETEEVKPETVHIRTNEKTILRHVKPQESKYWHFKFIDQKNTNQMTNVLQNIQGYRLTVEYSFKLNTADIILKQQEEIVGKIHLLLCDKRDANLPNKYYCKLFFFHFKNNQLFQAVKTALVNFFENFKPAHIKAPHIKAPHIKAPQKRILRTRKASLKSPKSLKSLKSLTNKNVTKRAHKYSLRPRKVKPN